MADVQQSLRSSTPHDSTLPAPPAPPPGPTTAQPPSLPRGKSGKKGKSYASNDQDVSKALLSKIHQLEASNTESAHEQAEVEAEVKKATRDLSGLLTSLEPHASKLDIVQKRYADLVGEMTKLHREHNKAKKRGDQLQKEKEELGKERTRERGLKEKLEKLSRELTRENKKLKEDLRDLKENSADRNEELHQRLESLVLDVEEVVANRRPPERERKEDQLDKMFREKFTSFLHQYELRELHFQSLIRVKELEIAYHIARHDALKKAQENELSKSHQLTRQVSTFSQTENELRGQLNVYVEKFKQVRGPISALQVGFEPNMLKDRGREAGELAGVGNGLFELVQTVVEDTLNNSNDLFLTFRKEMEEMSKKTKRLEKENLNLNRKQEATNKNIFQMAEERSQSQQTIDRLTRENEKLKKLCRAMQSGGYGGAGAVAGGHPGVSPGVDFDDGIEGETESEYDDEEYDEDEDGEEYDDDTEEDGIDVHVPPPPPQPDVPRTFGPPPPPPPPQTPVQSELWNGKRSSGHTVQMNGGINGTKH